MSVRDSLLAILTLGPAYGHQLHHELRIRAAHRGPVNVGQIYSTLDRLTKQKLIQQHDSTDDGLPLNSLTEAGSAAARAWMSTVSGVPSPDWTEMLDQVLITSTIDVGLARRLAARFEEEWTRELERAVPTDTDAGTRRSAIDARRSFAQAAIAWLGGFGSGIDETHAFGYSSTRPRRGRRPRSTVPLDSPAT